MAKRKTAASQGHGRTAAKVSCRGTGTVQYTPSTKSTQPYPPRLDYWGAVFEEDRLTHIGIRGSVRLPGGPRVSFIGYAYWEAEEWHIVTRPRLSEEALRLVNEKFLTETTYWTQSEAHRRYFFGGRAAR